MLITKNDFDNVLAEAANPIILSFGAGWSGNAEMMSNMLKNMNNEFNGQIDVYLADIELDKNLADQYGIREVPTTLIFNNGEVVDFFTGLLSKGKIRQKIESSLAY